MTGRGPAADTDDSERTTRRATGTPGLLAVGAGLAAAVGVAAGEPVVLASCVVPLVALLYATVAGAPDPAAVDLDRALEPASPSPGDRVTVRLTVTNTGERTLTDLRVVDGVPRQLGVVAGSPRAVLSLRPGESATVEYALAAKRGDYAFGDVTVVTGATGGGEEATARRPVETTLSCELPVEDVPLTDQTALRAGRVRTDHGGHGLTFDSIREFHPSDPMSRVDWRGLAKTGELKTVDYQEEHAATVCLLIDAREGIERRGEPAAPLAVDYCAYAGQQAFGTLLSGGNKVGVAVYPDDVTALAPAVGREHAARARELFVTHPRLAADRDRAADRGSVGDRPGDGASGAVTGPPGREAGSELDTFRQWLPDHAQVVLVSPLLDDRPVEIVDALVARGHDVTVVAPRITGPGTVGETLVDARRLLRLRRLRGREVPAVDWTPDDPLTIALETVPSLQVK